jgi:uncharacterized YigZ family protein
MSDVYRTLSAPALVEVPKVKGSRFIGEALPVRDKAEAEAALEAVRQREPGATHHCWAWRLGADGSSTRSSDDGEPGGTAGAPILRQIEARDLTGVLVVVTRYYGGTKLGTGGLFRAYGEAASRALDDAPAEERLRCSTLSVRFAYDDTSPVMQTLHRFGAEVVEQRYTGSAELVVAVRASQADSLSAALTDALSGRVEVEIVGEPRA